MKQTRKESWKEALFGPTHVRGPEQERDKRRSVVFAGVRVIQELTGAPSPRSAETQVNRNLVHASWHARVKERPRQPQGCFQA